ncbi:MAG: hypothetical protein LBV45_06175 [Xanthomonadaceae bacterium]|nr:hypothetical protein [Xanthomonadaceae bacterium]
MRHPRPPWTQKAGVEPGHIVFPFRWNPATKRTTEDESHFHPLHDLYRVISHVAGQVLREPIVPSDPRQPATDL